MVPARDCVTRSPRAVPFDRWRVGHAPAAPAGRIRSRGRAREGFSPAEVAERIDRFFPGEFATFLYVVYEPGTGELRFTNAGHLPPLLVSARSAPRLLTEGRSVPLGLAEGFEFEEASVDFPPGSTIVIYTDAAGFARPHMARLTTPISFSTMHGA